jgi:hypothetical protein
LLVPLFSHVSRLSFTSHTRHIRRLTVETWWTRIFYFSQEKFLLYVNVFMSAVWNFRGTGSSAWMYWMKQAQCDFLISKLTEFHTNYIELENCRYWDLKANVCMLS